MERLRRRISHAIMELIRNEDIDIFFDFHEASLMYPGRYLRGTRQVNGYCHDGRNDAKRHSVPDEVRGLAKNLRGLTHREVGDFSNTLAILMETPEAFYRQSRWAHVRGTYARG